MERFEQFMEAWGLLTLDWTRSSRWYTRWAGIAIGAAAMWLMAIVMMAAVALNAVRYWWRRALGKKPR
jgi:hypothetical protein